MHSEHTNFKIKCFLNFYSQLSSRSKYRNINNLSGGENTTHVLVCGTNPLSGLLNGGKWEITCSFLYGSVYHVLNCRVKGFLSASGLTAEGMMEQCLERHMALRLLLAKHAR